MPRGDVVLHPERLDLADLLAVDLDARPVLTGMGVERRHPDPHISLGLAEGVHELVHAPDNDLFVAMHRAALIEQQGQMRGALLGHLLGEILRLALLSLRLRHNGS